MTEAEVVELLLSRNGCPTRVVATDGEPMDVRNVVKAAHSESCESYYVERGGIPVSADDGRYYFYSNEIDRIEDVETGAVILQRKYS